MALAWKEGERNVCGHNVASSLTPAFQNIRPTLIDKINEVETQNMRWKKAQKTWKFCILFGNFVFHFFTCFSSCLLTEKFSYKASWQKMISKTNFDHILTSSKPLRKNFDQWNVEMKAFDAHPGNFGTSFWNKLKKMASSLESDEALSSLHHTFLLSFFFFKI